ncbi:Zinc finger protein zat9 [Thalictrum thalictroides]|uniref:Zinc finger protein zat9 n=1 Tax=Thalictrum thalictroides TaxID=46969 RepID=A0A7J6VDP1_THATH|nr:Zinc finger protein zat9 [Thalictrum thalictroides]
MEEDQEQKHVCKFCKKQFPCGRSLGGHMRTHMRNTPSEKKDKLEKQKASSSSINGESSRNNNTNYLVEFDAGGHVGYGLRENPKKTWRLSDSIDDTLKQEKFCKECGKGFQSWKALFGHMRCHSERERVSGSLEDDSWIMDSQSDTETAAPRRRKRSTRTRYKNTTTVTVSSSISFANTSSSASEIEQEQEEVAMCLMMLSRDVGYWGGLNSLAESSDNNSVVVEVGSSTILKRKTFHREDYNVEHSVKTRKVKDKNLKCILLESGKAQFARKGSDFGNFGVLRNGFKKLESDVSVNGSVGEYKFKKPKCDDEEGFEVSNVNLGKCSYSKNRVKCTEAELRKDFVKEVDDQLDSECGKYNSAKRTRLDVSDSKMEKESPKKLKCDTMDSPSKGKYECTACNKTFHSYQALGGHRASHKRMNGCFTSKTESSETTIAANASPDSKTESKLMKSCSTESPIEIEGPSSCAETSYVSPSKKNKHECPVCFKVFASGQALGGHKRCHVFEASEARRNQTLVIPQQLPEIRDLLDLNLPAPVEEDTTAHIGFNPWWIGNNHQHEQAVGLIFN